ncbi:saccharopine dehydrogenase NADP-binding domain-containing protein [Nocardia sp. NPDC005825]|uniref:saccharopine dehydrogenase family protein n=1 Tax=unclassified Nocardia TaxID=2637762 RepID=UPI0033DA8547
MRTHSVIVIGAGGAQAQAMLRAAARGADVSRWLAVDRAWRTEARQATEALGIATTTCDPLSDGSRLDELLRETEIVANFAGPYYRTGTVVLDAAIANGTDYFDICDDSDVTLPMLERRRAAADAGITAVVGMGSSPGTSNILIRAAVDHLGPVDKVDISWTVDVADCTDAATRHIFHCFNVVDPDGTMHPVPTWEDLDSREVTFPGTVGTQTVVRLAHPEPITVPLALPVAEATNYGAITPIEAMRVSWALAFSVDAHREPANAPRMDDAIKVLAAYRDTRPDRTRIGSGLQIDVHTDGNGLRFTSGATTTMEEATGVPAAAGLVLLAEGLIDRTGVLTPEMITPADFFATLRRVSVGGGGLELYRLEGGRQTERLRIRDLLGSAIPADRSPVPATAGGLTQE